MNLIIYTKDDYVERVHIECNSVEWLVLNEAMRQFAENKENHQKNREIIREMSREKPVFIDAEEIVEWWGLGSEINFLRRKHRMGLLEVIFVMLAEAAAMLGLFLAIDITRNEDRFNEEMARKRKRKMKEEKNNDR